MTPDALAKTVRAVRSAHRERVFLMDQRKRADNALGAFLRRAEGWRLTMKPDERKVIEARVKFALLAAERAAKGEKVENELYERFRSLVDAALAAREPFAVAEHQALLRLNRIVRTLPVWTTWAKDQKGVGEATIGTIIGEAGDLASYRSLGALFKRMGVAVVDGHRQGRPGPDASKKAWIEEKYSPRRRSYMWVAGDVFIKVQGPYRATYDRVKAEELAKAAARGQTIEPASERTKQQPELYMSAGHVHLRSKRRTEKLFLKHLRAAWIAASNAEGERAQDLTSDKDQSVTARSSSAPLPIDDRAAA